MRLGGITVMYPAVIIILCRASGPRKVQVIVMGAMQAIVSVIICCCAVGGLRETKPRYRKIEPQSKCRASAEQVQSKCRASAEQVQSKCRSSAEQVQSKCGHWSEVQRNLGEAE